ncbi:ATP-binding protein [Candidatus Saccharibacteria bacterium]|nr:ATP-binding protein [Candidatus Saccharibacteria bacterium]
MEGWVWIIIGLVAVAILASVIVALVFLKRVREKRNFERGIKMTPLLIHLPPTTDDIQTGSRDERDITNEAISQAQVMYSILASMTTKGLKAKIYGQDHVSFEIVAMNGLIKYYTLVPNDKVEIMKQAVISAYPTARLEISTRANIFSEEGKVNGVAGCELRLKKEYCYPINTYEDSKRDGSLAILGAMSTAKEGEGVGIQILIRPAKSSWSKGALERVQNIKEGTSKKTVFTGAGNLFADIVEAPFRPPNERSKEEIEEKKPLTNLQQEEVTAIENKTKFPAFETLVRIVVSTTNKPRSEAILSGVATAFSQFDSPIYNGFRVDTIGDTKKLSRDYILRTFPLSERSNILNSVELSTIFHLPEQKDIPTSQVERQLTKQVDGPAKLATEGLFLGVNEFRGEQKKIYLSDDDRRRHMYVIGQTGMGKSVFLENLAFQDMCDGKGFAFIDPHGDAVEAILQRVPKERIDDVIYFDPADIEHPVGMNMFEFTNDDQKDFIVQEGISMLQSLFDPSNQGFFGPRGQHMFRNAALLLMADPAGATFIDIPQCFTDPEFVKEKLKYVTDKAVYDYWTKEFPASQRSNDAGEVITWFASKWGPFLSNTIMRNTLGQIKSGFNIREIMDNKKIFLVNLSKGRLGDINANLLGMIFVMKFQQAAMSRQDIPEHERKDFCLYVDEFQNFATDSFESILSEARKYRLNLIVANQFMTQLTDKIREALLGNVGTIMCGRIGVTDADLMVKAFTPVFTAEDLTKTANHQAICKVMIFGMPSSPFTISLPPPMGEASEELMKSLKIYTASKYGRTRAEVEAEIRERQSNKAEQKKDSVEEKAEPRADGSLGAKMVANKKTEAGEDKEDFLAEWMKKKKEIEKKPGNGPKADNTIKPEKKADTLEAIFDELEREDKAEQPSAELNKPTEKQSISANDSANNSPVKEPQLVHGKKVKVDLNSSSQEGVIKLR